VKLLLVEGNRAMLSGVVVSYFNWSLLMKTTRLPTKVDGILLRPSVGLSDASLDQVAGCLRSKRKPKTLGQMRTAIGREVIRRHDRGRC
jgi:hypothetical protein